MLVSCEKSAIKIDYLNHQYSEFIETILDAYSFSHRKASIVELKDETAVIEIDDGEKRFILFDLKNQRVISSNYKPKNDNKKKLLSFKTLYDDIQYNYIYDDYGNVTNIKSDLVDYKYSYNNNSKIVKKWQNENLIENKRYNGENLDSIYYANNYELKYIYDMNNLINKVYGNDDLLYEMSYNCDSSLKSYYDIYSDRLYQYNYYNLDQFKNIKVNYFDINYTYIGNIINSEYKYKGLKCSGYKINNSLYSSNYTIFIQNDISDRPKNVLIDYGKYKYNAEYEYVDEEPMVEELTENNYEDYIYDITSDTKVKSLKNNLYNITYKYNDMGLISYYAYDNIVYEYFYDNYGQLKSYEINGDKKNIDYDEFGNIIQFNNNQYSYTSVGNLNLLASLNGQNFKYDNLGNPIRYKDYDLIWNGRKLKKYGNIDFNYDKYGNRVQKKVGEKITDYYYDNSKIIYEISDNYQINYIYLNDSIVGLKYNNKEFYYVKNIQNDVLAIVDESGNVVVSYIYDPFGNVIDISGYLKDSLGIDNPIRFKSYYYDKESDLYYLNSRYYDSSCGRFISPDDIIYLQGTYLLNNISKNLYAYCMNDPINKIDEDGTSARWVISACKFLYADLDLISDDKLGATMLVLNGGNVYTAFHETAQILAADQLQNKGYSCSLEHPCNKSNGSKGEIDILADFKYVYEVKNYFDSQNTAEQQVRDYVKANPGYAVGNTSFNDKIVNFLGNKIKMRVQYVGFGVIKYSFSLEYSFRFLWKNVQVKRAIEEDKLKKALMISTWAGIAVAGSIIVATIVEDFVTYGVGVADDAYSIGIAASSYSSIVSSGVLCFI